LHPNVFTVNIYFDSVNILWEAVAMAKKIKQKPYHHGDLYETLVKAGTELLNEEGLDNFTLRECARRAGVSHAAPKNHFDSVEDLLSEIAARGFEQFVSELGARADSAFIQTPDDRMIAMGRAYIAFARANPAIYLMMFRHQQQFSKSQHLMQASHDAWMQLEESVAAVLGPGRDDARARAAHVWALVHGIASLIIDKRFPANVDPELVIDQSLSTLPQAIRGL
jgi:AcrR family transcriptional regulator